MILIGHYDSPYVRRVAVSLTLLGIDFERNPLSVFSDADAMRRINPLGRIPSLVLDDGEVLIDSGAILDHLDEQAGAERALVPRAGQARRRALHTVALATGAIDKAGAIAYERLLRPAERVHEPWIERCKVQLEVGLAALEAAAPDSGWFGGSRMAQPDITAACALAYVRYRAPQIGPLPAYPKLACLSAVAEARAEFEACLPGLREIGGPPDEAKAALARLTGEALR